MAQQKITADQVDTLNQNTTGTASNVTGTVAAANGGTGLTSPGTSGNVLTSNGTTWTSAAPAGGGSVFYKDAVRAATTANITLSGNVVMDGITTAAGDRILVKNQSTASQNGIYVAAAGAWTRATDFDASGNEVANGCIIPVQFGNVNGGSVWQVIQNGGTIGNSFKFGPVGGIAGYGQSEWTPPVASGPNAIAIGNGAVASGSGAIRIATSDGGSGGASGSNAIAIGQSSGAGSSSITIGQNATVAANTVRIGTGGGTSSANWSVFLGHSCSNSSNNILVCANNMQSGFGTVGDGLILFSTGNFASGGLWDRVVGAMVINGWTTTTNATPEELGVSGSSGTPSTRITLMNDASYILDCDIIARNTATDTESKAWNLKFAIRRGTSAANTALIGSAAKTVIGEDSGTSGWNVSATADTTNGRPNISVTGEASKTIRWVANIRMTRVAG